MGEVVGGYSAYRAGGDILSGVAIGGVIGAVTGYAGGQAGGFLRDAMGGSRLGYVFGGATRGAIMGMGGGSAASYAGGIGDWGSVVRGAYRGAAIGGIAGGVLGYLEYAPKVPSREGLLNAIKTAARDGAKNAAQKGDIGALFSDVVKEVTKAMAKPALNFLADNPELGYDMIAGGVGVEETDHFGGEYFDENGVKGRIKIKF